MGKINTSIMEVPEQTRNLAWNDTFFDQEKDVIAVFDFDYQKIESFQRAVTVAAMFFPPVCMFGTLFCCLPCLYPQQIHWDVSTQHVCITQDGIKFVHDKRKFGCGFACQDQGKTSKTIPFDKITDCDVTEPAGATCICIENILTTVNVDTASGNRGGDNGPAHELTLVGLEKPNEFKALVWAMKRAQAQGGIGGVGASAGAGLIAAQSFVSSMPIAPGTSAMDDRGEGSAAVTNAILRDIRKELQELNAHLREKN